MVEFAQLLPSRCQNMAHVAFKELLALPEPHVEYLRRVLLEGNDHLLPGCLACAMETWNEGT